MVVGKTIGWALPVAALLAACGGGGGTDVDGGGGGGPGLAIPTWSQRIEPFEPKAAALKGVAQGSTSSRAMAQAGATRVIALAPLQRATPERAAAAGSAAVPRQIGTARAVAETADAAATAALLQWRPTARGTQVAALRFESPLARGVRLGVLVQALPPGAVLRFHGREHLLAVSGPSLLLIASEAPPADPLLPADDQGGA